MRRSVFVHGQSPKTRDKPVPFKVPRRLIANLNAEECQSNWIGKGSWFLLRLLFLSVDEIRQVESRVVTGLSTEGCRREGWKLWARIFMSHTVNRFGELQEEHKLPPKDSWTWFLLRSILQAIYNREKGRKITLGRLIRLFRGSSDETIPIKCSSQHLHTGSSMTLAMGVSLRGRRRRGRNLLQRCSIECPSVENLHENERLCTHNEKMDVEMKQETFW